MKILDFAKNLNSLGVPEGTMEVLRDSIQLCSEYPEAYSNDDLKKVFAEANNLDNSTVTFGAGATEIIYNLPRILNEGRVLIPSPTFWQYTASSRREKKQIVRFPIGPTSDFQVDYGELRKEIEKSAVVYLCNPNNPTSKLYDTEIIKTLAAEYPHVDFVIDETYLLFIPEFQKRSLMAFAASVENVYVVISFSKFYSIPGLRTGILVSSSDNIQSYEENMIPYTLSPISVPAIKHVLRDRDFVNSTRQIFGDRINQTYALAMDTFSQDTVEVIKPEGPFVLLGFKEGISSTEIEKKLKERGLLVRDCATIDGLADKWVRASCRSRDEMEQLFVNLSDIIQTDI
ncbi:MAG: histidinol-phosphate transaminase [Candidatus Gracilibacteria bacterium]|jgi:histidinol-phosphate/aromatic aminotransferase/cobyric acid decarboxylase-like protein